MACSKGPYGRCTRCGTKHFSTGSGTGRGSGVDEIRDKAIREQARKKNAAKAKKREVMVWRDAR